MGSAYCYPRLTELDVLMSGELKYAIAERGYRLETIATYMQGESPAAMNCRAF